MAQVESQTQAFLKSLAHAQGRSEFVIVVVADIRGFSAFSTRHESPNIAMFVKRFYCQMITKYFDTANFVKPTGDGLLMTFPYSELDLAKVSETVFKGCFSALNDFPNICANDPMINFTVPQAIGFGIARGTACCLYSEDLTLDYSGHLLNLASRLMDLARPSGIVVDGNYLKEVVPQSYQSAFVEKDVYIRSIAEETPIKVLCQKGNIVISDLHLSPLKGDNWRTQQISFKVAQLKNMPQAFRLQLEAVPKSSESINVEAITPNKLSKVPGLATIHKFGGFKYLEDAGKPVLQLDLQKLLDYAATEKIGPRAVIQVRVRYPARPTLST